MNNVVTNNAVDDLLQIVKAYVNQNAELKAVVAQQKEQIVQLQAENKKLNKSDNEKDDSPYLKDGEKVDPARMEIIEPDGSRISYEARMAELENKKEVVSGNKDNIEQSKNEKKDAK